MPPIATMTSVNDSNDHFPEHYRRSFVRQMGCIGSSQFSQPSPVWSPVVNGHCRGQRVGYILCTCVCLPCTLCGRKATLLEIFCQLPVGRIFGISAGTQFIVYFYLSLMRLQKEGNFKLTKIVFPTYTFIYSACFYSPTFRRNVCLHLGGLLLFIPLEFNAKKWLSFCFSPFPQNHPLSVFALNMCANYVVK